MKDYKYILIVFVVILLGCNNRQSNERNIIGLQKMDTLTIKKSVLRYVNSYIAKHPETDFYILKSMQWYKDNRIDENNEGVGIRSVFNEIYEVACANSFSFDKGEFVLSRNYPSQYFVMGDKVVFVSSDVDALYNQKKLREEYIRLVKQDVESSKEFFLVSDLKDTTQSLSQTEVYSSKKIKQISSMVKIVSQTKYQAPVLQHLK